MVWQKIDDQFGVSRSVIGIPKKRRQQCVGLWTLAGNYAARSLTDGRLEAYELDELDARPVDVDELVRVGLWHRAGDSCDSGPEKCPTAPKGGISIHNYLVDNPSREKVLGDRESERVRKAKQRKSVRSPSGTPTGRDPESGQPVPVPSQSRPDPMTDTDYEHQSSHLPERASARTDVTEEIFIEAKRAGVDDLPAVLRLLEPIVGPLNPRHGIELATVILRRARTPVVQSTAYIARACEKPDEIRHIATNVLDLPGVSA